MPRTTRSTILRSAAAGLCLAMVPLLSGCALGVAASTTNQGPSGNGSNANSTSGTVQLRAVTIVTGDAGVGTVIGTIVNSGTAPDALTSVVITDPKGATTTIAGSGATGGVVALPAQRPGVRFGFDGVHHIDVTSLTIAPTAYATVEFHFQVAGIVTMSVMAVPPTGIFQGITPLQG